VGRHDQPTAGRTPEGRRGAKPGKEQVNVQTEGGAFLWKQIAALFSTKKKTK
jgi:hypothetical protein